MFNFKIEPRQGKPARKTLHWNWLIGSFFGSMLLASLVITMLVWFFVYPLKPAFQLDANTSSVEFRLTEDWELSRSIELAGEDIRLVGKLNIESGNATLNEISKIEISSKKQAKTYFDRLTVPAGSKVFLHANNHSYLLLHFVLEEGSSISGRLKFNDNSELCAIHAKKPDSNEIKNRKQCIALNASIIPATVDFSTTGNSLQLNVKPGKPVEFEGFEIGNLSFARKFASQTKQVEFRCGLQSGTIFFMDILEERKLYKQFCLTLRDAQAKAEILWTANSASVKVVGRAVTHPPQLLPSIFYYFWKLPNVIFFRDFILGFISMFIAVWGLVLTWKSVTSQVKN